MLQPYRISTNKITKVYVRQDSLVTQRKSFGQNPALGNAMLIEAVVWDKSQTASGLFCLNLDGLAKVIK